MSGDSQQRAPFKAKGDSTPTPQLPGDEVQLASVFIIERRDNDGWQLDWLLPQEIVGNLEDSNVILPIFTTKEQAIEFTALQQSRWPNLNLRWREFSATFTLKESAER